MSGGCEGIGFGVDAGVLVAGGIVGSMSGLGPHDVRIRPSKNNPKVAVMRLIPISECRFFEYFKALQPW
jgi:hypothetical protein